MAETPQAEELVAIATRTYDALPKIAHAFLEHAMRAGFSFDIDELRHHSKFTFDSATITFQWCDQSHISHGVSFNSNARSFNLWFEVRGWVALSHGDTRIYSQRLLRERGYKEDEFEGNITAFTETA
jgi:hypothetical protein